jgi:drug/metabolite transporter (DMT)-like permease
MDWKTASLITLFLWGVYGIFAAKAGEIHGAKVSLVFEAAAFVALAAMVAHGSLGEFAKVTRQSFMFASLMGLFSAAGFYFLLRALQMSPDNLSVIIVMTGLYPVITVMINHFLGSHLSPHQWVGVAFGIVSVILVNWPR